jgi:hypothetical protein
MDKARRPHVVRTWTVERTRVPYRPLQPANLRPNPRKESFPSRAKPSHNPNPGKGLADI